MTHVHDDPYHPHRYTTLVRNFGEEVARRIAARRVQEHRCAFCGQRVEHGPALVCKTCRAAGWRYCGDCQRVVPLASYTGTGVCQLCRRARYNKGVTRPYKKPTKAEQRRIIALYRAGKNVTQIAAEFQRERATIYRILANAGVTLRRPNHMKDERLSRQVCDMYMRGMTCREIRERTGVNQNTIYRMLRRAGIPPRTKQGQASGDDA